MSIQLIVWTAVVLIAFLAVRLVMSKIVALSTRLESMEKMLMSPSDVESTIESKLTEARTAALKQFESMRDMMVKEKMKKATAQKEDETNSVTTHQHPVMVAPKLAAPTDMPVMIEELTESSSSPVEPVADSETAPEPAPGVEPAPGEPEPTDLDVSVPAQPAADEPAPAEPAANDPAPAEPAANEPAPAEPATNEPAADDEPAPDTLVPAEPPEPGPSTDGEPVAPVEPTPSKVEDRRTQRKRTKTRE